MGDGILVGLGTWGANPGLDAFRIVIMVLMVSIPLVVFISAMMPWRHEVEATFDEPKEGMVGYIWISGVMLLIALLTLLPSALSQATQGAIRLEFLPAMPGFIIFLSFFFSFVLFFAYMKRVVFNAVMRRYRREVRRQRKLARAGVNIKSDASALEDLKSEIKEKRQAELDAYENEREEKAQLEARRKAKKLAAKEDMDKKIAEAAAKKAE